LEEEEEEESLLFKADTVNDDDEEEEEEEEEEGLFRANAEEEEEDDLFKANAVNWEVDSEPEEEGLTVLIGYCRGTYGTAAYSSLGQMLDAHTERGNGVCEHLFLACPKLDGCACIRRQRCVFEFHLVFL
jgi:hypothetical protein